MAEQLSLCCFVNKPIILKELARRSGHCCPDPPDTAKDLGKDVSLEEVPL